VKRKHKHILEISRALRFQAGLPLSFWGDCVLAAVYIINRLPSSVLKNKTPFEVLMQKLPDYHHLKVFGCLAMASNPSRSHDKFDPRRVPCLFVGYPSQQNGYRLLNLLTNQYFVSRDVVFYEHIFPCQQGSYHQYMQPIPSIGPKPKDICLDDGLFQLSSVESTSSLQLNTGLQNASGSVNSPNPPTEIPTTTVPHQTSSVGTGVPSNSQLQPARRSHRPKKQPVWMKDFVTQVCSSQSPAVDQVDTSLGSTVSTVQLNASSQALLASINNTSDPVTFLETIQEPKWCEATDAELRALEDNGTWQLTSLPTGKKVIGCKRIYRIKFKSDGSIEKCKARLVALGCRQKFSVDYWETFAPAAKMITILLAVASIQKWHLFQMDVSNAFLHGDLAEELYMTLSLGYAGYGQPIKPQIAASLSSKVVCKLEKSLYGLCG